MTHKQKGKTANRANAQASSEYFTVRTVFIVILDFVYTYDELW